MKAKKGAKPRKPSRLTNALLETAADMHKTGNMNDGDYTKLTMRHLGKDLTQIEPVSADKIRDGKED